MRLAPGSIADCVALSCTFHTYGNLSVRLVSVLFDAHVRRRPQYYGKVRTSQTRKKTLSLKIYTLYARLLIKTSDAFNLQTTYKHDERPRSRQTE